MIKEIDLLVISFTQPLTIYKMLFAWRGQDYAVIQDQPSQHQHVSKEFQNGSI